MLVCARVRLLFRCLLVASLSILTLVNSSPFHSTSDQLAVLQRVNNNGHGQSEQLVKLERQEFASFEPEVDLQTPSSRMPITSDGAVGSSAVQTSGPMTTTSTAATTTTTTRDNCPNCLKKQSYLKSRTYTNEITEKENEENELQKLRIEEIKRKILKKLRMVNRPNVTIPRSMLPLPLQGDELQYRNKYDEYEDYESYMGMDDDYYGKTERVIVIAENVDYPVCNSPHHDPAGCFHFKLAKHLFNREVSSAELWTYKLRDKRDNYNQTFIIHDLPSANYSKKSNVNLAFRDVTIRNGWIKFNLTHVLKRWLQKSRVNIQGLRISCKTCAMNVDDSPVSNEPNEKPFIVINFASQDIPRRGKRNTVCQPNSTYCCRDSLYVNFTQIGWSDWIFAPEGYYANYCRGTCMEEVNAASHHATVIQQYLVRNKSTLTKAQVSQLVPCCTATKTSPISIVYTRESDPSNIVYNSLPNMVVDSCGCK